MKDKENAQQAATGVDQTNDTSKTNTLQETTVAHNPLDNNDVDEEGNDIVESGLGIDE